MLRLLLLPGLLTLVAAYPKAELVFPIETGTKGDPNIFNSWTPRPTDGPSNAELLKRASNPPASICGYSYGDPQRPLGCGTSFCGFNNGLAGCCANAYQDNGSWRVSNCNFPTTCYNYGDCFASAPCAGNPSAVYCGWQAYAAAPYCVEYTWTDNGYVNLGCTNNVKGATVPIGAAVQTTTPSSSQSSITIPGPSDPSTSPPVTPSISVPPTISSSSSSSSTPSPPSAPASSSKSGLSGPALIAAIVTPICSILGLIFGIGFKIWKHKKNQKTRRGW